MSNSNKIEISKDVLKDLLKSSSEMLAELACLNKQKSKYYDSVYHNEFITLHEKLTDEALIKIKKEKLTDKTLMKLNKINKENSRTYCHGCCNLGIVLLDSGYDSFYFSYACYATEKISPVDGSRCWDGCSPENRNRNLDCTLYKPGPEHSTLAKHKKVRTLLERIFIFFGLTTDKKCEEKRINKISSMYVIPPKK